MRPPPHSSAPCSRGLRHESIDFGKCGSFWKLLTEHANRGRQKPMIAMDTAAQVGPGRTVAEHVYAQIKADLLTGTFTPGAALLTRELLARYGCGISPLREAL